MTMMEYISVQELAQRAGENYQTILNAIKAGRLTALTFGRSYAISQEDAQDYLETGGEEVTEEAVARLERRLAAMKTRLANKTVRRVA
jgi:excisionase family DNA binding protein